MSIRITIACAATMIGLTSLGSANAKPQGEDPNACAHVEGKPVFDGKGFKHVVSVRNTCTHNVSCRVWTNVDEAHKAELDVPAYQQRETTLRDGSPVSLFRAEANCHF